MTVTVNPRATGICQNRAYLDTDGTIVVSTAPAGLKTQMVLAIISKTMMNTKKNRDTKGR